LDLLAARRPVATVVTRLRLQAPAGAALRACSAAPSAPEGPTTFGRQATADAGATEHGPPHGLDPRDDRSLVRPARARGRRCLADGSLVSHRSASRAPALGAHPRSARQVPPQALLCTALTAAPEQILAWFVQRWQLEVIFHAMRADWGMET